MSGGNKTIVFFPEGAFGPTNNCVGIGDVLRRRGHRVVFIIEESFTGTLAAKGFEERLMRLAPPPAVEEVPGQFWKDFIRETAPEFRKPTIEQIGSFLAPTWQALVDGATYVDERLREIYDEVQPDIVVEDNVVSFPALPAADVPWVRIASCNPAEITDPAIPPVFSGYATTDPAGWKEFWAEYDRVLTPIASAFSEFCVERGAPPLPPRSFIHESEYLNLYVYPEEADYRRQEPLGPTWHRLDSSVRTTDEPWPMPPEFGGDGRLIYLSLGSLASADVTLMKRLVATLAETPHHYIVSKGPQHDRFALADNMHGAEFLPQTSILPNVDLVITHGGNNTVTEAFHFGKPMIVLPVFWDQYDNAQRVDELGFGVRLPTYEFEPTAMHNAIDELLGGRPRLDRLAEISSRLRADPGTTKAADLIERVAATRAPVG
ncbi:MAG: nucleotide disphospho-sugar-binding domain-containing protein [Actinomycetota bacterium]